MLLFYTVGYFFSQRQWSIPKPSNFTTLLSLKFYIFITLCICVLIVAVKPSIFAYLKYRLVIGALTLSFIPFIISGFLFIKDTWGAKLLLKFSKYSFTLFPESVMPQPTFPLSSSCLLYTSPSPRD